MIEYEKRAMIEAEDKYTFRQSTQISMQTGLIGHLRADMDAKAEVQKAFPQEEELAAKTARLNELNALLNLDKSENEIVDGERGEEELSRSSDDRER